jgi:hypothetical protein
VWTRPRSPSATISVSLRRPGWVTWRASSTPTIAASVSPSTADRGKAVRARRTCRATRFAKRLPRPAPSRATRPKTSTRGSRMPSVCAPRCATSTWIIRGAWMRRQLSISRSPARPRRSATTSESPTPRVRPCGPTAACAPTAIPTGSSAATRRPVTRSAARSSRMPMATWSGTITTARPATRPTWRPPRASA